MTELVVQDATTAEDTLTAQVKIGESEHTLTYSLPGVDPAHLSDALAIALLPHAMSRGMRLELPDRLSPRLERGLATAQEILGTWWPAWSQVEIRGRSAYEPDLVSECRGTACFFTGGVDSFHSVLTEIDQLEAVIFVHGFDVPLADGEQREHVAGSLRRAAHDLGLELIEVESNVKDLTWRECRWGFHAHGAALASVAQLAASRFDRVLIPATHSYRHLFPWGSHSLIDHLWSTDAVEIVHHGALPRTTKVATVATSDVALRTLRCCNEDLAAGTYNCGHCEKCLRTMASLRLCNAVGRCQTLPDRLSLRELARLPVLGAGWAALTQDILEAAEDAGDRELARALRHMLRVGPWRSRWAKLSLALRRRTRRIRRWGRRRARRNRGDRAGHGAGLPDGYSLRPASLPGDREAMLAVLRPENLHRIPSPEMDDFDVGTWLVAEHRGTVVGLAGFRLLPGDGGPIGKALLLAVASAHRRRGVGRALHTRRRNMMRQAGAHRAVTNSDRPVLIAWYEREFGYRKVGEIPKIHDFGRSDVDRWTTLEVPLTPQATRPGDTRETAHEEVEEIGRSARSGSRPPG